MNITPPHIIVEYQGDGTFKAASTMMISRAEKFYEKGETYAIDFGDPPSDLSKRHFFAVIRDAWKSLPDELASRFMSPEHLRKWATVKSGFADETKVPCDTPQDAERMIMVARKFDPLCVIPKPKGNVVTIYTAKSIRKMKRPEFQICKDLVFGVISDLIGVTPHELAANGQDGSEDHRPNPPDIDPITDQPQGAAHPTADTPATESPGGPTPAAAATPAPQDVASTQSGGSGQTETSGGGDLLPHTLAEYRQYLTTWLGFTKSTSRIMGRLNREKETLWPKLHPPPSETDQDQFHEMAMDAMRNL